MKSTLPPLRRSFGHVLENFQITKNFASCPEMSSMCPEIFILNKDNIICVIKWHKKILNC